MHNDSKQVIIDIETLGVDAARQAILSHKRITGETREDIAAELGIGKRTLDNKLNSSCPEHVFNLTEFKQVCKTTGTKDPIKAYAAEFGLICFDPVEVEVEEGEIVDHLIHSIAEVNVSMGQYSSTAIKAVEDKVIDSDERLALMAELRLIEQKVKKAYIRLEQHEPEA